jgi:tRNA (guanine-1)-methyltransferase
VRFDVLSIFPEYLAPLELSLIGKAREDGLLSLNTVNLRDYTFDRHRTVDDTPYGGGAGMVMKPEPWGLALDAVLASSPHQSNEPAPADTAGAVAEGTPGTEDASGSDEVPLLPAPQHVPEPDGRPLLVVPSPAGAVFNQEMAYEFAAEQHIVFACGRYEGIDERVLLWASERFRMMPVSIGDYVLNGGEVAVMAMIEATARLIPGVIGNPESLTEESHTGGLLEYPVFTKPASWRGFQVPPVLLSGNHGAVARWRRERQIERTMARRPDLFAAYPTQQWDKKDRRFLAERGIHFPKPNTQDPK